MVAPPAQPHAPLFFVRGIWILFNLNWKQFDWLLLGIVLLLCLLFRHHHLILYRSCINPACVNPWNGSIVL